MKKRVVRTGLAEVDLLEHLDYIAVNNPDAALRFVDTVEQAFARLAEMPEIGALREFANPASPAFACGRSRNFPDTSFSTK